MLIGGKYKFVSKKGEGTFSEVIKAQTANSKFVAIKRMKNHFDSIEQVNNLREVQALKKLSPHPGVIKLLEVVFERTTGRLSLVFELMEMNIYELIRGRRHYLAEKKVKLYMYQLLKAMDHMHRNGIFHRDIKPENILLNEDKLKVADFGSCRGVKSKQPFTEYISTRWYRAPECLLTDGYYNYKMDMWGIGCVFFEVLSLFPLFPGTNELDQIQKIHNIIGTPPPDLLAKLKRSVHMNFNFPPKEGTGIDRLIPNAPPECVELIKKLLAYNPDDRLSARQALRHPYFKELREGEKRLKHGTTLYPSIKAPEPAPEETKKAEPEKPKLGPLPHLKPPPYITNITNITNNNITNSTNIINNITNNITTNILNPTAPAHGAQGGAQGGSQVVAASGISNFASTTGISSFSGTTAISNFGQSSFQVRAHQPAQASKSIGDLPSLHSKSNNSLSTVTSGNPGNAGNAGHAPQYPLNSSHVSSNDLLHKKEPKKLPTLRPNKQDIEFIPEIRKDSPPHNTTHSIMPHTISMHSVPPHNPPPYVPPSHNPIAPLPPSPPHPAYTTTTTMTSTGNAVLPSIKGTGWKR